LRNTKIGASKGFCHLAATGKRKTKNKNREVCRGTGFWATSSPHIWMSSPPPAFVHVILQFCLSVLKSTVSKKWTNTHRSRFRRLFSIFVIEICIAKTSEGFCNRSHCKNKNLSFSVLVFVFCNQLDRGDHCKKQKAEIFDFCFLFFAVLSEQPKISIGSDLLIALLCHQGSERCESQYSEPIEIL
jgi:hypothetical protein